MDERKTDEIRYKANSRNAAVVMESVDILVASVARATAGDGRSLEGYLRLLRELCAAESAGVACAACRGLVALLERGHVAPARALDLAMSVALMARNFSGITWAVARLLAMTVKEVEESGEPFVGKWQLVAPIHPFVLILQRHPSAIRDVHHQMTVVCSPESSVYKYSLELLRPVFLWTLCSPSDAVPSFYKFEILKLLLSMNDVPLRDDFILHCLSIQQTSKKCNDVVGLYTLVADWAMSSDSFDLALSILPTIAHISEELITGGENPQPCFQLMKRLIIFAHASVGEGKIRNMDFQLILNYSLGLLSNIITICPIVYLEDVIILCNQICQFSIHELFAGMMICSLLQWEYKKGILTENINAEMRLLIDRARQFQYDLVHEMECDKFNHFKRTSKRIYLIVEQHKIFNEIQNDNAKFDSWIANLNNCTSLDIKSDNLLFLQSLVFAKVNSSKGYDISSVVKISMDVMSSKNHLMISHLPIVLHCLRLSQNPAETMCLLYTVPQMAAVKENIPIVVCILKMLDDSEFVPKPALIRLYIELIRVQGRCFPYLQTLLSKAMKDGSCQNWELLTAKANALKYICETKAVTHGTEVVPILSDILDKCGSDEFAAACCLSIRAIALLWKAKVIDPISTWQIIAPKFHGEKRIRVNIEICNLLAIVPHLYYESPEFDDFIDKAMSKLWRCIIDFDNEALNTAAFSALSKFDVKYMSMRQLPDVYKQGIELPASFNKIQTETTKTIDDMSYIPSTVWGNLFQFSKNSSLPGVRLLCRVLMNAEVSAYHSGMYNIAAEPGNLKFLPPASIVRGVVEYARRNVNIENPSINHSECLKCLSEPLEKPLPPLNWSFLLPLLKDDKTLSTVKVYIVKILSKQAETSQSALKMINNYVENLETEKKDVEIFAEIIHDVVKHAKTLTFMHKLETFMAIAHSAIGIESEDDITLFRTLLNGIKKCLIDDAVQENVKNELVGLLRQFYNRITFDSLIWPNFAEVCCCMGEDNLLEFLVEYNDKTVYLLSKLIRDCDPESCLIFLNDIISIGLEREWDANLILSHVNEAMKRLDDELLIQSWVLKLLTRIQNVACGVDKSTDSIAILCDIVVSSILSLSSLDIFSGNFETKSRSEAIKAFPCAVLCLFSEGRSEVMKNLGSRIVEWCHCHRRAELIPEEFRKALDSTMVSYCSSAFLQDSNLWNKYVSVGVK